MEQYEIDSCIRILEFFRSDPIVIKDFLSSEIGTPWDYPFKIKYKMDNEKLIEDKKTMIDCLINKYYDYLIEHSRDDNNPSSAKTVDELHYLFYSDEFYCIKVIKYFVNYLSELEDFNICTFNLFKYNIFNIKEIVSSERELMGLNHIDFIGSDFNEEFQRKYCKFSYDLFHCIKNYIDTKVEDFEEDDFINYLFSIAYAYIQFSAETNEELDKNDKEFLELVASDVDLPEFFFNYPIVGVFVIECVYDAINEYSTDYDLRSKVSNEEAIEVFKKLDSNFGAEFDSDIVINSITLDNKLNQIMAFFKTKDILPGIGVGEPLTNDAILDIIEGKESLYEPLVALGLDGRYEDEYRKTIIRKIVADVYEYLDYALKLESERNDYYIEYLELYDEMKKMTCNWKSIYTVFYNNYSLLLDIWYKYSNKDKKFQTNACIESKKNNTINKVLKINYFSIYKYIKLKNTL